MNDQQQPASEQADQDRDQLEGSYTEIDGQDPPQRAAHGGYTRSGSSEAGRDAEGSYVDEGEPQHTVHERHGKYVRREP